MAETDKARPGPNHLLKQARLGQGLTEAALAAAVGVTKVTVSRWEHGISKPSPHFYKKLLEVLKKQTIQELGLGLEDEEQESRQPLPTTDTASEEAHPQQPSLWSVPRRNPFFTGREEVLKRLHSALTGTGEGQSSRPLALTGVGGIGKTQTALEYAWCHRGDYQVVCWAWADNADILAAEVVRIAQTLNLTEAIFPDRKPAIAAFRTWMHEQSHWLLVLDNVGMPETLQDFLPEEPRGHILMTSRAQALGTIAQKMDVSGLEPEEGAWFLLRRTQKVALDAPLDAASLSDQQQARAISKELGDLPLALEQAGAYIEETGCSLQGYHERYRDQHAELLARRGALSDPEYPWTVATTWTLSFRRVKQMNQAAAELLRFLAYVNPDAVPLSLVRNAAPGLPRHLRRAAGNAVTLDGAISDLRRFSLVQRHTEDELSVGSEALSMHPLVQTVLKDVMPARTQRRWAERTVKAVRRAFKVGVYIRQAQACAVLIEEWRLMSKEAADLLYRAGCHAQQRQLNRVATSLFQQALPICERIGKTNSMLVVCCLFRLGQVYEARQQFEEAESSYQRAIDVRTHLRGPTQPTIATCKFALGQLYAQQGKEAQAEAMYRELVEQDPPSISVLEACAALYVEQGRYAEAEALIQQEVAMLRAALEPTQPAYLKVTAVIPYLADLYLEQGKTVEAETLIQQEVAPCGQSWRRLTTRS